MNFLENEIYYHESHEGDMLGTWDRQVVNQNWILWTYSVTA